MKNFENRFEFEPTTEPETAPELNPLSSIDASGWDSLADVPFAGDISTDGLLDCSDAGQVVDVDIGGLLD